MGTSRIVGSIRAIREIQIVEKDEFDQMWMKAFPAQRFCEITLPVMGVLKDGVYYVPFGSLQMKDKEN